MTTRKDVEEALNWFRCMFKRMYIPCKVLEVIEQALQEKLEQMEKSDEE
jgi:hypothetical protein